MKILDVPQSGSMAGTTSSRNRFGQYRRSRRAPVNVNSEAQQASRNALASNAVAWRSLTEAQRLAWAAYAATHPTVDSLGSSVTLTGFMMYCSVNSLLIAAQLDPVVIVPDDIDPGIAVPLNNVTAHATFNVNLDSAVEGTVIVSTSPPLSAGRSFNNDFRIVSVIANPDSGDSILVAADMVAKWGTLAAGQKFFIRTQTINVGGSRSAFQSLTAILT